MKERFDAIFFDNDGILVDTEPLFLQATKGPVFTQTNCQQGHTSPGATGSRCLGYFWCAASVCLARCAPLTGRPLGCRNMANASARDYFVENLVQPLATAPMIDGIFYDAFNCAHNESLKYALEVSYKLANELQPPPREVEATDIGPPPTPPAHPLRQRRSVPGGLRQGASGHRGSGGL